MVIISQKLCMTLNVHCLPLYALTFWAYFLKGASKSKSSFFFTSLVKCHLHFAMLKIDQGKDNYNYINDFPILVDFDDAKGPLS